MDIANWLRGLGLGQYEATFRDNAIEPDILADLTETDLEKLGIPLGHRKRLLKAIAAMDQAPSAPAPQPVSDAAERRQVTVMFCDLVGSTAMSTQLDPEDMRSVIGAYHRCCGKLVEAHGGFIAKYMGDGVLAYFGYPHAHEHDAERGVQTGLALVSEISKLSSPTAVPLRARVGLATGLVVVGDLVGSGAAQERGIVGETPNLAARLQSLADPDMVVVSESTRRLVGNLFELRDLGTQALKGIDGPVRAFAALRPSAVASRFEAMHADSLTALVGRDEELDLLMRRWSKAESGEGQVVLVFGEAGIGKSRLTTALMEHLTSAAHTRLRYFGSPQHTESALHPVIVQLERAAGFSHDDTAAARLDKLDALLAQSSTSREDAGLIADILLLANDGRYPALDLAAPTATHAAGAHRPDGSAGTATTAADDLRGRALDRSDKPRVVWARRRADRELAGVADRDRAPGVQPPWVGRPGVTTQILNRLAQRDVGALIERVIGNKTLPANIRQDIIERTDGIPLCVEEMTKAVLEAASEGDMRRTAAAVPASALPVPASLHASLMARLDRLGPGKEVIQIGAAIGREFSHAVIAAVARRSDAELEAALDRVIAAGLLLRHGVPPQATYLLKHALVQDAAYGLLLREPRRTLHARIADALENEFAEIAEAEPEIVAQHFARAELSDRAALYFERAGDRGITRCAYAEAVAHFATALAQLERMPQSPERSRRELAVLLKQGPAVLILRGWQHVDVEQVYQRACVIARSLDDQTALFKALWGLWFSAAVNRRTDIARERAEELVALSQRSGDESLLLEAMHCRWSTGFFRGEVASTLADALEGASLYDPVRHSGLGATFGGHDPGVCAHSVAGLAYAQAGNPGDAVASVARAIALAQTLNQPPSEAFALMNGLTVYAMVEDRDAVTRLASQTMAHADKFDLPVQRSIATFMSAWARACGDQIDAGLQAMEAEFGRVCLMGPIPDVYTGVLARVRFEAEQAAQALELLDGVLNSRREPGVGVYMPELHRLRGECLLRLDPRNFDRAVQELETAVAVGKRQHAGAFHLAAAISLARACAGAGQPQNGIAPLQEAVGSFSIDADTPQLTLARAMLAEMC